MLKAQEGERERLALDLHDGLGAKVSTLRLENELLCELLKDENKNKSVYIQNLIEEIQQDVRIISRNLVPRDLERSGLIYELDKLQFNIESVYHKKFTLTFSHMKSRLPYVAELNIFRMIQELVNNTIKHAEATTIVLDISNNGNHINILYKDNGKGFDQSAKSDGIGLFNIRTRAAHLNGQVLFNTDTTNGFEASIQIPTEGINYL